MHMRILADRGTVRGDKTEYFEVEPTWRLQQ
jgi:hypothetical protein